MDEISKQNSINLVISTLVILSSHYIGLGAAFFWFAGIIIMPAIAVWFQFKFALGNFILRLSVAVLPWLILCLIGLWWASETEHDGMRAMNMFYFEMPLYSVAAGTVMIALWFFYQKLKIKS